MTELLPYLNGVQIVALTLWGEARGENILGRVAVGCVIRNRAGRRKQTMRAVCLAPLQFSCWTAAGGKANHEALIEIARSLPHPRDAALRECLWIAEGLADAVIQDVTRGADHYLTGDLYRGEACPSWAKRMAVTAELGGHVFLRY